MRIAQGAVAAAALLLTACSSGIETTSRHIEDISPPPRTADARADLQHCSRSLEGLDPNARDPYSELLRAAVYHRMYELDAVTLYRGADDVFRAACPGVGAVLGGPGDPVDLLAMSFRIVADLRAESRMIDEVKVGAWIRVEKELAVADFLRREAAQGASAFPLRCVTEAPREAIDLIVRAEEFAMAAHFYARAEEIAKEAKADDARPGAGGLACLAEARASAERLAAWPGRDPSFTELWKELSGEAPACGPGGAAGEGAQGDPRINYHFDVAGHLKEGRELIPRAEKERMDGKTARSLASLEEALRHFLYAWLIAKPEVRADRDCVVIWLDTILSSLQRLTWAGADRERELVEYAGRLPAPGEEPASAADRLRLAALLRRIHTARPSDVLANVGDDTRQRCAGLSPWLEAPGPLARAGALAVRGWRDANAGASLSPEDRVEGLLILSDALLERPAPPKDAPFAERVWRLASLRASLLAARRALEAHVRTQGKNSPSALAAIRRAAESLDRAAEPLRAQSAQLAGLDRILDDIHFEYLKLRETPETPLASAATEWRPVREVWAQEGDASLALARAEPSPAPRLDLLLTAAADYEVAATLRDFAGEAAGSEAEGTKQVIGELAGAVRQ